MPNWCSNYLLVSGEEFEFFKEDVKSKDSDFSLAIMIGIPEFDELKKDELKTILSKSQFNESYFNSKGDVNWYDYCINYWGTKWDVSDTIIDEEIDSVSYSFQSAWSPPEAWLKTISKWYNCNFELICYEEGCDFWYHLEIENGKIIDDTTKTIREKMLEELDEQSNFEKVRFEFYEKFGELVEEDPDILETEEVEEIEEFTSIIDNLDCEFGSWQLYQYFDEYFDSMKRIKKFVANYLKRKNYKN